MSLERRGFVGLFREKLTRERMEELVAFWIERFGAIEQTVGNSSQVATLPVRSVADVVWEKDIQFRVLSGEQFAWIYATLDHWVIETSGLASPQDVSLSRDVLSEAPGCAEIIDDHNDRRLDELEARGLM